MPVDLEQRRAQRREKVKRLERRLRDLKRKRKRREIGRRWRPIRNVLVLVLLGAGAWFVLPRVFDAAPPDVVAAGTEAVREEIEDLQDELIEDVSDVIGKDIPSREGTIELEGVVVDGWAAPLDSIDAARAVRPHHTYAAWDYGTRVGTPVYAMTDGVISFASADDGARCGGTVSLLTNAERARITYCHLSEVFAVDDMEVRAGDMLGLTGGAVGAPGAGRSSGPHLHLQIKLDGELYCPQAQLVALEAGVPLRVSELPVSGCWYSSPSRPSSGADAFVGEIDTDDPLFEWDP